MPKSLEDGHIKFTILTVKPANPESPLVAELNAGIDAACAILNSDFQWSATDSDKNPEKPLCQENNVNSLGAGNYQTGITLFRSWDSTNLGQGDATADVAYTAVKQKGTTVWAYARRTGKKATDPWAAGDEIYLGGEVLTDTPQVIQGGFIKGRIPLEMQAAYDDIEAAA